MALKRELNLFSTTLLGIAVIIGAGIYSLIGKAAGIAGDSVWASFLLAGLVAVFTGLSFAELSSIFPKAGSIYVFIKKAFKKEEIAFTAGWLIVFELIAGASLVSLALAGYFNSIMPADHLTVAITALALFSLINLIGVKTAAAIDNILALIEVSGLIIVIAVGLFFAQRSPSLLDLSNLEGILSGASIVFFAYIGFEAIAIESEETKSPKKTIPKAILLAVGICMLLFILVSIASVNLLPPSTLYSSNAPAADAVKTVIGEWASILSIIAIIACATTILVCLLTGSRLLYGLSKEKTLPPLLNHTNKRFATPHYSILLALATSVLFLFLGDLKYLAEVTNFGALFAFALANAAVITLRKKQPKLKRTFRIPFNYKNTPITAVLGIISCTLLLTQFSIETYASAATVILIGLLSYYSFRKK